jgi:hypothetical protein
MQAEIYYFLSLIYLIKEEVEIRKMIVEAVEHSLIW